MTFYQKLQFVQNHLENGDKDLGFRKLMDCVLDTQNPEIYKTCILLVANLEVDNDKIKFDEDIKKLISSLEIIDIPTIENSNTLVEAKEITKSYGKNKFSIGPINLEIVPGDVWGLVGENGNGKTTLLRVLAGEIELSSGEIAYNGSISSSSNYDKRTELVYIPQRTPTWFGSLKDNLKFAASHYGTKGEDNELIVNMYIIRFGLWKFRNHKWSELSSGYKMRFELARTFLRKPKILLLDEPLANLDVMAQQLILEDLQHMAQSLAQPMGIILSSQQLFEVEKISNKVLYLKHGKPTFLDDIQNESDVWLTILEIDMQIDRKEVEQILSSFTDIQINYNGGIFYVYSKTEKMFGGILKQFIDHNIEIKYVRDISASTRRLFL